MSYLDLLKTALLYITYPFVLLFRFILTASTILIAPLLHLGHYILLAFWWPLLVLAKFETLYIFFGVAILVGSLTGTSLHYAFSFLISALRLGSPSEEERGAVPAHEVRREKKDKGKMAWKEASENGFKGKGKLRVGEGWGEVEQERVEEAYKRAVEAQVRAERKAKKDGYVEWGKIERGRGRERKLGRGRRGVLTSTILEEENSSDAEF